MNHLRQLRAGIGQLDSLPIAGMFLGTFFGTGTAKVLRVSAFSTDFTPLNGCGVLFNLNMRRVSGAANANSPLIWAANPDNFIFIDGNLGQSSALQDNGYIGIR